MIVRSIAVSATKALTRGHPNCDGIDNIDHIDLDDSIWIKSLFQNMGFWRLKATTCNREIPAGAQNKAELLFHG